MPIKLQKGLFIGDFPLSQYFGNKLIIDGVDIYAKYGLKGHNGLDYAVPLETPLTSCLYGTVIENLYDAPGYGNYIKIENEGCGVLYAHLKRLSEYKPGMRVCPGTVIGASGNTGNSTGPHLHFAVFPKPRDRKNGYRGFIDPLNSSLVEWVEKLDVEDNAVGGLEEKIENLETSIKSWKGTCDNLTKYNATLTAFLSAQAQLLGITDFDPEKDLDMLSNRVGGVLGELTAFKEASTLFTLLGKDVKVIITPHKGVIE
jgi:hypothetical protein